LNRYSYVLNSPLNYVDPSGYSPCEDPYWATAFALEHDGQQPTAENYAYCVYGDNPSPDSSYLGAVFNHSQLGAIIYLALVYNLHLPAGVSWSYFPDLGPGVGGTNPVKLGEELGLTGIPVRDEELVYISELAFTVFDFDPAGVISVLIHEARHAWVEYYRESAGLPAFQNDRARLEIDAYNVVMLAVDYGIVLSDEAIDRANASARDAWLSCGWWINGCWFRFRFLEYPVWEMFGAAGPDLLTPFSAGSSCNFGGC